MQPTVIHVSPHPDDESIAAPCSLLTLRDAGWKVINYSVSLGRPADHERRRQELKGALAVAGFDLREAFESLRVEERPGISGPGDHRATCVALTQDLAALVEETGATLVVGPHPRDGHHGHTAVARAIRQVVWTRSEPLTWWMWSLWADLPRPTLVVPCDPAHVELSEKMIEQYSGENERNDYRRLQASMRVVNAVRGVEKTFGYGSSPRDAAAGLDEAELLTEVTATSGRWMVGRPRVQGPASLIVEPPGAASAGRDWLPLDDMSILSNARLRPLYHPRLLSTFAKGSRLARFAAARAQDVSKWTSGGAVSLSAFREHRSSPDRDRPSGPSTRSRRA